MKVISFTFGKDLVHKFVTLSNSIYKDDPNWIPPFTKHVEWRLSPSNPFFSYGSIRNFMVFSNKEVWGRISAIINNKAISDGKPTGYLGFFESVNNFDAAYALISAGLEYLSDKGIRAVYGPINFSTWYEYRFMTRGFEKAPFVFEPHNPRWYPQFFLDLKFTPVKTYNSALIQDFLPLLESTKEMRERFFKTGYHVRTLNRFNRKKDYRLLYDLSTSIFKNNWGYTNISLSEFEALYFSTNRAISPEHIFFAYDSSGRPIGFAVTFPNFYRAVKMMKGSMDLKSKLTFMANCSNTDTLIVKTLGVLPGLRKVRVGPVLFNLVYDMAIRNGYKKIILALMAEGNTIRKIDVTADLSYKEYVLYEYRL